MDWMQLITIFAVISTNLFTVIALHKNADTKINAILKEVKDIHVRLSAIEERKRSHDE